MFINLTKAFDLVSRKGLFTLLQRIGCPSKLLRMITSFHECMQGTVQYDGSSSDPFPIRNGVKQGYWLRSCCLQMMLPWLHTLRKLYSDSSAASHMHVENLVLLSVLRRPTSWAKTSVASQASPSATTSFRWWRISPTLVPPSPATSPWMPNWTHGLARQWQQWLTLQRGSGKTPCWSSTPRWRYIKSVCSAHCSVAVKHGLCTPTKNADSMPSTCAALEGFWASPGKTMCQTRTSWLRLESQGCLPCLPKATCTGLVMSAACRMAKSPKMFCMVSLPLAPDWQEVLFFTSKSSVNEIWKKATAIQQAGKL